MTDLLGSPFLMVEGDFNDLANLTPEALEAKRAQRLERAWTVKKRDNVAIMAIHGAISRYDSFLNWIRGGTALEDLALDLKTALDSPEVKAIILDVDSPGGEAAGINEFAEMIQAAKKPVVAYVGNQAASAALWIASAADEVMVNQTAELGSLGVVFGYRPDESKIVEIVSTASPKKRLDPGSKEGKAEIQGRADDLADIFIAQVAKYRKTTVDKVKSDFGQGGMMIASKAIKAGMADRYGSLEGLIAELQAKNTTIYGGTQMGFKTDLRALVSGVPDSEIETGMAALGFVPKATGPTPDMEKIKTEAMAAGKAEAAKEVKAAETARVTAVMEKAELAGVTSAKFTAELLGMTAEEAGQKIIDAQADESLKSAVFSTVNPMSTGGPNALVADAKKRAGGK
ncbi:MAG: S49 family peptidase [Desulfobacterium sp.]|nr:S49 family peptidase [Desulfobacterium sp.]